MQSDAETPSSAQAAITQLRDIVVALCVQATQDPTSYERHWDLVEQHVELRARAALKLQQFADRFAEILTSRGAAPDTASFASQIAVACYQTGKHRHDNDPRSLVADVQEAFNQVLSLGSR